MSVRRRVVAAGLVAAVAALGPTVAAHAAEYPPGGGDSMTVDSTSPLTGTSVLVSAQVYRPGSDVAVITVDDAHPAAADVAAADIGGGRAVAVARVASGDSCATGSTCTVVAGSDGVASADVALTAPGRTTVTITGKGADGATLTQTLALNVRAAAGATSASSTVPNTANTASGSGNLPQTGASNAIQTALIGAVMLLTGTVLVLLVRRRRDALLPI